MGIDTHEEDVKNGYDLSEKEIKELLELSKTPLWHALKKYLSVEAGKCLLKLRAFTTPVEEIRFMQGRSSALHEFANFVERDLESWYHPTTKKPSREG